MGNVSRSFQSLPRVIQIFFGSLTRPLVLLADALERYVGGPYRILVAAFVRAEVT